MYKGERKGDRVEEGRRMGRGEGHYGYEREVEMGVRWKMKKCKEKS